MAKNWYDGPVPTADLGILGGLPSLALTEEDKKRAFWQAMMQGGMGMAAASLGGANTSQALGKGLLGGADAYGQGLMAPQGRFDAYAKQLKVQGDQIGNAKGIEELGKLKREASDYGKQNDFFSMLNDPGQAAMLYGGGPTLQNEQRATQFGANPAAMLSDPRINLKALQARVDPKQLGAALENTRPYMQEGGKYYNGQYLPDPTKGIAFNNGVVAPLKGAQETQNALAYGTKAGELAAQLAYEQAKLPNDVRRAGQVADAEAGARDRYGFFQTADDQGRPVWQTNPQARSTMGGNQFAGARMVNGRVVIPNKAEQGMAAAVSDLGPNPDMPLMTQTREQLGIQGGSIRPQVADLPGGVRGQSPSDKVQTEELGRSLAKYYEDIRGKANDTNSMLAKYKQINQLLGDFEGGKLSPTMTDIASAANSVGMKIDPKLANKEAARNIVATMMGDFKSMLPGSMSDADRKFLSSIPPSESTSATGRAKILMVQEKLAERASQEHDMANKWIAKYGKLTPEFEQQLNHWRRSTRMFDTGAK